MMWELSVEDKCGVERTLFKLQSGECGGHGICTQVFELVGGNVNVSETICECDDGWTGESHWVNGAGSICHVNIAVVRAFWAVDLFLVLAVCARYFGTFWGALIRFRKQQMIRSAKKLTTQRKLSDHTTLFCMVIWFFIHAPIHISFGFMSLVDPIKFRVANCPISTFLWFAGRSSFYVCTSIYQPALLRSILGPHTTSRLGYFQQPRTHTWMLTSLHIGLGALSFVALGFRDDILITSLTWVVFCGGTALVFFVMSFQAYYLKRKLTKQLAKAFEYYKNPAIKDTQLAMENVQNTIIRHAFIQAMVYSTFAGIPGLWIFYSYLLPVSWITIPTMARQVSLTLMIENKDGSHNDGISTIVSEAPHMNFSRTEVITKGVVVEIEDFEDPDLLATGESFRLSSTDSFRDSNATE